MLVDDRHAGGARNTHQQAGSSMTIRPHSLLQAEGSHEERYQFLMRAESQTDIPVGPGGTGVAPVTEKGQRSWTSYEREVRDRRGKLIKTRRGELGLGQKNLVEKLGYSQSNISNIESGQLPRQRSIAPLAKSLQLPQISILTGLDCATGNDTTRLPNANSINETLVTALSEIAGERIDRGVVRLDTLVPRLGAPFLARSIDIFNAALEDTAVLTTGADLVAAVKGPVRTILDFSQSADQSFKGIPELLFAAHEKVVHCYSCVAQPEELLGLVSSDLTVMSRIADEYPTDRMFRQQFLGRKGDVLKVCGWKFSDLFKLALIDLRSALQLPGKLRCQAVRSAFVVGAQCAIPDPGT
jgi:transcriptional regulator with XRE-family HTH domain